MSRTILLADDSPTIQKVVELTFAETEYDVVAVSSGNELLARLPEVQPEVVICDVLMPDRDGYEVCEAIKSNPATLHIPVVLLTGTFEPFDRDRALAAGCDEIVTKPFEARQLIETVERLTSGAGAVEEPPTFHEEGAVAPPQEEAPAPVEGSPWEAPAAEETPEEAPPPAAEETGEAPAAAEGFPEAGEPTPESGTPAVAPEPGWGGPEAGGVPEEGLDFTTTGFAEMEAAGERPHVPMAPPEEGLELEPSGEAPVELPLPEREEEAAAPAEPEAPFAAEGAGEPEPAPPAGEEAPAEEPSPFEEPAPETPPGEPPWEEGAFGEEPAAEPAFEPPPATAPVPTAAAGFEAAAEEPPAPAGAPEAEPAAPPEAGPEEAEAVAEPAVAEAEAPPVPEPEPEEVPAAPEVPTAAAAPPTGELTLSDADIERIARRVVELAADRIERIAWEVIPDMAEIVVRERIRELEAELESEGTSD